MIEYIQKDTVNIPLEEVAVNDVYSGFSSVNESHMKHVEISTPIILAEIAPGRYNVIDGNHRLEKAHLYLLQGLPWHQVKKVPSV
jgi:phosphopantothenoylcysteine synthetase/decarboxylase